MKRREFILLLLLLILMPVAFSHEGEPIEEHSLLSRIQGNKTIFGGAFVLILITLAGYFMVKKRRTMQNEQPLHKQDVHASDKIMNAFVIVVISVTTITLLFTAKSVFFPSFAAISQSQQPIDHFGAGGFTEYDLALAQELMDKDGDGECDVCGMDIQFCINNGQLQCDMGQKTGNLNIGILDKTKQKNHYHADFNVFINGKAINFNKPVYFVKSRFIHVENDKQGDSGDVLHMHATGVPLWIFFDSIGMRFDDECFDSGDNEYCTDDLNSLKFYVNGKKNEEFGDYVFKDNDRLLISYGAAKENVMDQMASVNSFSQNH